MFDAKYIARNIVARDFWKSKRTFPGDWYIYLEDFKMDVVSQDTVNRVDFSSSSFAYIPDLDDLMELINNQIEGWGDKSEESKIKIEYNPAKRTWWVEIRYAMRITRCWGNSMHEALQNAWLQMSVQTKE